MERAREASGKPKRVDIRAIKRAERVRKLANRPLETVLKTEKRTIVGHLMDKMDAVAEATEADILEAEQEAAQVDKETAIKESGDVPKHSAADIKQQEDNKENEVPAAASPSVKASADAAEERDTEQYQSSDPIHNLWSEEKNHAPLPDLVHDKPFVSDGFKAALKERNKRELAGLDVCDVEDCFCKEEPAEEEPLASTSINTASASGVETPVETPSEAAIDDTSKVKYPKIHTEKQKYFSPTKQYLLFHPFVPILEKSSRSPRDVKTIMIKEYLGADIFVM